MIRKLLIANRGEIAVRIIRAAREMGIRTVAVFSEADANSIHSGLADEAIPLGASEPSESYLNAEKVLRAAKDAGADAIHPGYGFLAESADFADEVTGRGIAWVGPPASAMRKLGSKIEAKKLAVAAGVPVVPGYFERNADSATLLKEAKKIGFPVMLKASGGGGGRGMRIVRKPSEFDSAMRMASDEAENAFGDGQMMVEKLIERPRHVEVQILADAHGNVAALFERECSIQRRHQKLIEETPAPSLAVSRLPLADKKSKIQNPKHRIDWPNLRDTATSLASAAGYQNAGTVEFMVDQASSEFYFLEVNARLQVEHPITEMVTGIDLVKWQLRIASGAPLSLSSELSEGNRTAIRGHAIEARIVAEDPARGFLPGTGRILGWTEPRMPGVRVDTGHGPGSVVSRYYDSLLAKVIAHGENRSDAIEKLKLALLDFHILGVPTNIAFLLDVLSHPKFVAGDFDTGFLEREFPNWSPRTEIPRELGEILAHAGTPSPDQAEPASGLSAWESGDGFRNAYG